MMNRKKIFAGVVISAVVAVIAAMVIPALVQQGPGPGGPGGRGGRMRGMMGNMMYLERTWTAVSFQLDCTSEQLQLLRPTYRAALQTRNAKVKAAREAQDWQAIATAMTNCKSVLDAKLKDVLSTQQWSKLQTLVAPPTGGLGGGRFRQGGGR